MARKRYNEEDVLRLLREIEVNLHGGMDVVSACHTAPFPTPSLQKNRKACPAPRSGRLAWFLTGALPQPFRVDIHPEPVLRGPWPHRLGCRPHGCGWPLVPQMLRCQG